MKFFYFLACNSEILSKFAFEIAILEKDEFMEDRKDFLGIQTIENVIKENYVYVVKTAFGYQLVHMKKKNIAIVMMLLLSAMGAMAQGVENRVGRFSVIPRIGVAIANLSDNSIYLATENNREVKSKSQAGFSGGLDVEYRATDYLGVSLGAYYARQGARWGDYEIAVNGDTGNNGIKKYTGVKDHHLNLDYVQVPLMLKAYVAPQFAIMAGAQVGFLCGDGKMLSEETDLEKDNKTGSTLYKESRDVESTYAAKKVNVSIPVGLSYEYLNVILDARYHIGLTKVNKVDAGDSKNKVFTFTVGYRFGL